MKKTTKTTALHTLTGFALAFAGSCAFASSSWNLTECSSSQSLGNSVTCGSGSASGLTLYGYSNGSGSTSSPSDTNFNTSFSAAGVYDWGDSAGLGIISTNETDSYGPHAMDNTKGIDALLVKFSTAPVNLESVKIGWNGSEQSGDWETPYHDSDLSVFAWKGTGAPSLTATNPTGLMATNSGWEHIGNFTDVGNMTNNTASLNTSFYSSYWLISAYSSAYNNNYSTENDAFKLLTLAGNACTGTVTNGTCGPATTNNNVPEPGSLALVGAALMGFVASRRRKPKAD